MWGGRWVNFIFSIVLGLPREISTCGHWFVVRDTISGKNTFFEYGLWQTFFLFSPGFLCFFVGPCSLLPEWLGSLNGFGTGLNDVPYLSLQSLCPYMRNCPHVLVLPVFLESLCWLEDLSWLGPTILVDFVNCRKLRASLVDRYFLPRCVWGFKVFLSFGSVCTCVAPTLESVTHHQNFVCIFVPVPRATPCILGV